MTEEFSVATDVLSNDGVEVERQPSKSEKLVKDLKQMGVQAQGVDLGQEDIREIVVLTEYESSQDKLARVYRGITSTDANILMNQIPYAMRDRDETGKLIVREELKEQTERLAHDPSYKNLISLYDSAVDLKGDNLEPEVQRSLLNIEEDILNGYSVRSGLMAEQINHIGGIADLSITPYTSATFDLSQARGYTQDGFITVIDLPVSELQERSKTMTNGETNIKGSVTPEHIRAFIPIDDNVVISHQTEKEIEHVLNDGIDTNVLDGEELMDEVVTQAKDEELKDISRKDEDLFAVRQRRTERLMQEYPQLETELRGIMRRSNEGEDFYSQSKQRIYDYYKNRYDRLGNFTPLKEIPYGDRWDTTFSKEKADEHMLRDLKDYVSYREEKERPMLADALGLSEDTSLYEVLEARDELVKTANEKGIHVSSTPTRSQIIRLRQQLE